MVETIKQDRLSCLLQEGRSILESREQVSKFIKEQSWSKELIKEISIRVINALNQIAEKEKDDESIPIIYKFYISDKAIAYRNITKGEWDLRGTEENDYKEVLDEHVEFYPSPFIVCHDVTTSKNNLDLIDPNTVYLPLVFIWLSKLKFHKSEKMNLNIEITKWRPMSINGKQQGMNEKDFFDVRNDWHTCFLSSIREYASCSFDWFELMKLSSQDFMNEIDNNILKPFQKQVFSQAENGYIDDNIKSLVYLRKKSESSSQFMKDHEYDCIEDVPSEYFKHFAFEFEDFIRLSKTNLHFEETLKYYGWEFVKKALLEYIPFKDEKFRASWLASCVGVIEANEHILFVKDDEEEKKEDE